MLLMPTNAPCACMRTRKAGAKLLLFPEIRKKKAKYFRWVLLIPTVVYNIIVGFDVWLCLPPSHLGNSSKLGSALAKSHLSLSRIARYAFVCKGTEILSSAQRRLSLSFPLAAGALQLPLCPRNKIKNLSKPINSSARA